MSPLDVDAMTVTLRGERSDSSTQTLTVTARVTSRQTHGHTETVIDTQTYRQAFTVTPQSYLGKHADRQKH